MNCLCFKTKRKYIYIVSTRVFVHTNDSDNRALPVAGAARYGDTERARRGTRLTSAFSLFLAVDQYMRIFAAMR